MEGSMKAKGPVVRHIKFKMRKPTIIVMALVPSSEAGKPPYKICLDKNNTVFCTCRGWRYNGHTCRHLTEFRDALSAAQPAS
jgi:hypothetical protein